MDTMRPDLSTKEEQHLAQPLKERLSFRLTQILCANSALLNPSIIAISYGLISYADKNSCGLNAGAGGR
jgi:hypothetical protein